MSELVLRNRQRVRRIDTTMLRRLARTLVTELVGVQGYELGVHLVSGPEMARINETFLNHEGSTDVITFDYSDSSLSSISYSNAHSRLHGEIFICLDDAVVQARRFQTTWQSELARYLVHGVLHLRGHDDLKPSARHAMKREENRLLRELERRFPLRLLAKAPIRAGRQIANHR